MRCAICGRDFSPDDVDVAMPFCSRRCRAIDAKRWFNEEYTFESFNLGSLDEAIEQVELQNLQGFEIIADEDKDNN